MLEPQPQRDIVRLGTVRLHARPRHASPRQSMLEFLRGDVANRSDGPLLSDMRSRSIRLRDVGGGSKPPSSTRRLV